MSVYANCTQRDGQTRGPVETLDCFRLFELFEIFRPLELRVFKHDAFNEIRPHFILFSVGNSIGKVGRKRFSRFKFKSPNSRCVSRSNFCRYHVGTTQVRSRQVRFTQISVSQVCVHQVRIAKVSGGKQCAGQFRSPEIYVCKFCPAQSCTRQVCTKQFRITELRKIDGCSRQIGIRQLCATKKRIIQICFTQVCSAEIGDPVATTFDLARFISFNSQVRHYFASAMQIRWEGAKCRRRTVARYSRKVWFPQFRPFPNEIAQKLLHENMGLDRVTYCELSQCVNARKANRKLFALQHLRALLVAIDDQAFFGQLGLLVGDFGLSGGSTGAAPSQNQRWNSYYNEANIARDIGDKLPLFRRPPRNSEVGVQQNAHRHGAAQNSDKYQDNPPSSAGAALYGGRLSVCRQRRISFAHQINIQKENNYRTIEPELVFCGKRQADR